MVKASDPRPAPKDFTRDWPHGPFESTGDPGGAAAAATMAKLAGQLTHRRKFAGQSQEAIGREAGVSPYTVSRIEAGSEWPRWDTMLRLCAVLGVRPTLVFDDQVLDRLPDGLGSEQWVREVPHAPRPGR